MSRWKIALIGWGLVTYVGIFWALPWGVYLDNPAACPADFFVSVAVVHGLAVLFGLWAASLIWILDGLWGPALGGTARPARRGAVDSRSC